jgi:hypothetical protein
MILKRAQRNHRRVAARVVVPVLCGLLLGTGVASADEFVGKRGRVQPRVDPKASTPAPAPSRDIEPVLPIGPSRRGGGRTVEQPTLPGQPWGVARPIEAGSPFQLRYVLPRFGYQG